jgi:hypothetical protein
VPGQHRSAQSPRAGAAATLSLLGKEGIAGDDRVALRDGALGRRGLSNPLRE